MFPSSYWWDSFGSLLQTNLFKTRILPINLSTKLFPIRFHDECLVSQKKHHYSFFYQLQMHLQLFNFPTPPQNSSCFIFISCPLICCAWCHQSGGISTTFVAITPIIQFPSTIGNYRKKKIKSFAMEKNVKKINSNISKFSTHSVKIT